MCQFFQYPGVISCFPCPGYIKVLEKGKKIYVRGWSCFHNKNEAGGSWSEQPVNWTVWLIFVSLAILLSYWGNPHSFGESTQAGWLVCLMCSSVVEENCEVRYIKRKMPFGISWVYKANKNKLSLHVEKVRVNRYACEKKVSKFACETLQCIKKVTHAGSPDRGEGGR